MLEIGQTAPDFSLFHAKGEKLSLSDLRGKKVVIAFVPAAFTGNCTTELCTFRDAIASYADLNAEIVGISVDPLFSILAWKAQNGIEFPVLSDYQRQATQAYGVGIDDFAGMPGYTAANRSIFVVDESGKVSWQWIGSPGTLPDFDDVKQAVS